MKHGNLPTDEMDFFRMWQKRGKKEEKERTQVLKGPLPLANFISKMSLCFEIAFLDQTHF